MIGPLDNGPLRYCSEVGIECFCPSLNIFCILRAGGRPCTGALRCRKFRLRAQLGAQLGGTHVMSGLRSFYSFSHIFFLSSYLNTLTRIIFLLSSTQGQIRISWGLKHLRRWELCLRKRRLTLKDKTRWSRLRSPYTNWRALGPERT